MGIYESIAKGLNEVIEYEKGRLHLGSNTLTITEPEDFNARDIKSIRIATGLSQAAFAAAMGVSKKTVEAWEAGRNTPSGTAKRLLTLAEENPRFFEKEGIVDFNDEVEEEKKVNATVRSNRGSEVIWRRDNSFSKYSMRGKIGGGIAYGTNC